MKIPSLTVTWCITNIHDYELQIHVITDALEGQEGEVLLQMNIRSNGEFVAYLSCPSFQIDPAYLQEDKK